MPPSTTDDRGGAALLLIDMINPFDYAGAEQLASQTEQIVDPVRALAQRFRQATAPVIYVNDNFGRWRSNFRRTVEACGGGLGGDIARALEPCSDDYFILKPQRSGFYHTPLDVLLHQLAVDRLILCGITTDMCVLSTANDACMRNLTTIVTSDGTASFDRDSHTRALGLIRDSMQAEVSACADVAI